MPIDDVPGFRMEKDAMGALPVPEDRLWGAQTQRSIQNFPIGVDRFRFTRPVIRPRWRMVSWASCRRRR
jgi:fumarate hydratase class II